MDATVRFWHGVMGAPLVATIGTDTFRHYFFSFGRVAFGRVLRVHRPRDEHGRQAGRRVRRARRPVRPPLDRLPDEDALLALRQRLADAGTEVTDVVDHGLMRSIYFTDPNGIALEASWWAEDPTGSEPDFTDDRYLPGRRTRCPRCSNSARAVCGRFRRPSWSTNPPPSDAQVPSAWPMISASSIG